LRNSTEDIKRNNTFLLNKEIEVFKSYLEDFFIFAA